MSDDFTLLDHYLSTGDQAAFRTLVDRHLPLIYNLARRKFSGNASHADDIVQSVFLLLAQKGRKNKIPRHKPLAAWLYQTTRYCCANLQRMEARRIRHESEAAMELSATALIAADFDLLELLGQALALLTDKDRDLLLLRYSDAKISVPQIAAALSLSPAAAEKRLARALQKLRAYFAGRNQVAGVAAIPTLLASHAITAPPHLFALVTSIATSSAAPSSNALALVANFSHTMLPLKATAGILVAVAFIAVSAAIGWNLLGISPVAAAAPQPVQANAFALPAADPLPEFILGPPPQRTYFADFSRNILPQGLFDHTTKDTLPAGWSAKPNPFTLGLATFEPITQRITLTSDEFEKKIELTTSVSLKPEWKRIVCRATLGSKKLQFNDQKDQPTAAAGVFFIPVDKNNSQLAPAIYLAADPKFGGWDKVLMATLLLPPNASAINVIFRFSDAKGILRLQRVGISPVDPERDPDPARVYAFQTAVKNNDVQTVTDMIAGDKRFLECRNMQWDCGTPLLGAAWVGHVEMVNALLQLGADPHAVDDNGDAAGGHWTACTTAGYHGRIDCFKALLDAAPEKPHPLIEIIKWGQSLHTNNPANYQACIDYILKKYPDAATQPATQSAP